MRHMLEDPAEMTPDQRRREVAAILARGVLRLRRCVQAASDSRESCASKKVLEFGQDCLDEFATSSPHVPAG